jgi:uncharacterized membrane protein YfcA
MEIIGTVVVTILVTLSVMAGIGGGGVIVPLMMIFFTMDTKRAVSISGVTILAGSIMRYIYTFKDKHPLKDATCVDYGISNIMLPTVLMGSILGVFFNVIFPSIILNFCLSALLLILTVQSSFKASTIYKKESQEKNL